MPEWYTYVIPTVYNRGLDKCPQGIVPLHWPGHAALELFLGNILRIDDYPRLSLFGVGGILLCQSPQSLWLPGKKRLASGLGQSQTEQGRFWAQGN